MSRADMTRTKGSFLPEGESDMQQPILGCLSQSIQAQLSFAMPCILGNNQWIVEEDTFCLGLMQYGFLSRCLKGMLRASGSATTP
jgi:hypothetical protein